MAQDRAFLFISLRGGGGNDLSGTEIFNKNEQPTLFSGFNLNWKGRGADEFQRDKKRETWSDLCTGVKVH